jgi:hypothetical protein
MENEKPMCDDCQEGLDRINEITEQMLNKAQKPTGLAAFGARIIPPHSPVRTKKLEQEKDEIESEVVHSPDCDVYAGRDCTCGAL